jgi:hypothetical protein
MPETFMIYSHIPMNLCRLTIHLLSGIVVKGKMWLNHHHCLDSSAATEIIEGCELKDQLKCIVMIHQW